METQQVQPRRGVQRVRALSRGRDAGAGVTDRRRRRHIRHGRSEHSANVAIHTAVREENRRLAPGLCTVENKKHSHCQPALRVQRSFRPLQAFPQTEA